MTAVSILYFTLAAVLILAGFAFIYYGLAEDNPIGLLCVPSFVFALIVMWAGMDTIERKKSIKEIKCSEYTVETIITTSSKGQVDTTYVIQYKSK